MTPSGMPKTEAALFNDIVLDKDRKTEGIGLSKADKHLLKVRDLLLVALTSAVLTGVSLTVVVLTGDASTAVFCSTGV